MVKCPRGTPSQIKANFQYFNQPSSTFSFPSGFFSWTYDPVKGQMVHVGERESEIFGPESEDSELESARADKRCPPNARDELVYYFISYFLDLIVESWESKPCKKPKMGPQLFPSNEGEYLGEDLGPCGDSAASSMADFLRDLSQKRSYNLSKEYLKKDSESTEFEYLNEVDLELPECADPVHAFVPDEEVHFKFSNGVWYKGRVSRKLMEGDGTYFWNDGSSYQGEFVGGCVTGKGRLEFSNMTVYEGDVYKAFRHGVGICYFMDSPMMYSGQWWLGRKHGYGLIVYNDPSEAQNFYRGQWQDGYKEGFGFRQYPSGSKYVGFWSKGERHGKGIMIWNNHDIYRGHWKEGMMHGYGEYTWNGFANKTLSYPTSNTYRGLWSEGKRNGLGVLECKNGALIETMWVDNTKNGPGTVICCNGAVIASENLFEKDKQAPFSDQEDNLGLLVKDSARTKYPGGKKGDEEKPLMAYIGSVERVKAISIPVLSPPQMLNLDFHIRKYSIQKKLELKNKEPDPNSNFEMIRFERETDEIAWDTLNPTNGTSFDSKYVEVSKRDQPNMCQLIESVTEEEKHLRNCIVAKLSELKACYDHYATLACDRPPSFPCILLRIFLWQMFIDAGIISTELSLIDIDDMTAQEESLLVVSPHDPFERIYFWQFLHILIMLSWHLYGQYVLGEEPPFKTERIESFLEYFENSESNFVLKSAFEYFLKNDIFRTFCPNDGSLSNRETGFEESDLAPMEAMYLIYCNIGSPHSARDFLNAVCSKIDKDNNSPGIVRYFEKLPYYKMDGRNALTVAGELHYLSGPAPFNHPELFPLEELRYTPNSNSELTCFNGLKPAGVLKCLAQVCPYIMCDGYIVNMDYKLTFVEFYKVIILCTERQLKYKAMKEIQTNLIKEYKSQQKEHEKKLENEKRSEIVSGKKSRQQLEVPKKVRKNASNE